MKKLLWLLLLATPLIAQPNNPSVIYVSSAPAGACASSPPVQVVISTGTMYTCNAGTWAAISSGGGSVAFSSLTSGTNTTAAMVVGSGASLAPSGTGTITATSAPITVGFTLNTGAAASPAVPFVTAPHAGSITTCQYTTTTSDAATDLVLNIKKSAGSGAGTSILSGSTATVSHTSTAKTQQSLTLTGTITVSALDEFELDVTGGTSSITGSIVCY